MAIDLFDETMGLLAELERHGVPYAVAGALALAIHGVPRATTDIDLLVRRDDVEATLEVARARGFRVQALPMRFSDGLEVRRSSKVDATVMLTLDLLLVNENLEPVWASREPTGDAAGDVRPRRHVASPRGECPERPDGESPPPDQGRHVARRRHDAASSPVRPARRVPRLGAPAARLADVASSAPFRQPRAEGVPGDCGMVSRYNLRALSWKRRRRSARGKLLTIALNPA